MAPISEPSLLTTLSNLLRRTPSPKPSTTFSKLAPKVNDLLARGKALLPRALVDPSVGVTPPENVPNKAFFALFGLIGVFFVVTGVWFFFRAKNGGFHFHENDWDDYKSTVLRRKGPNGTTLSGATVSTDLGGGSVVHGQGKSRWGRGKKGRKADSRYKDFEDEESTLNGSIDGTVLSSEMSEVKWKTKEADKAKKDRKQKDRKNKKSRFGGGDDGTVDERNIGEEEINVGVADTIRAYRHEKPARVGGLNKQSDGSAFDGSTQDGSSAASDLLSHREKTPTNTPTKVRKERNDKYTGGSEGIRKIVSTSQPNTSSSFWNRATGPKKEIEDDRIKAEAKKLRDKGRAAQRRDFSFQAGDDTSSAAPTSVSGRTEGEEAEERRLRREERRRRREERQRNEVPVPGSYYEESELGSELSGDIGTKSYHHPIPGLSSGTGGGKSDYAEERRKKRGYRRDE
ncbi:hypothetical protein BJ878DRAFT_317388 [Calycina marina]|uniref:Endosomal spry domain-containing protein n=1 Tax=Calycina marina TaxID=1763456 RepID=A0A9P7YUQ5_9HELO|nr:hypothetical protein BJ878DRAFT_317388 [Calycina marina]